MTSHSSTSIPQPKNWQDFERCTRILFECVLDDIHVQNNGRTGQPQHGVDVYGRKNGTGSWYGIQCKGKDAAYGGAVTEGELREEVEKSRKFEPPIANFILVTTAPADAAIQAVARKITEEREQEGHPLNVSVWGWGELESRISEHPRAIQAFHPDATPYTNQIVQATDRIFGIGTENLDISKLILQEVLSLNNATATGDVTSAALEVVDTNLHAEIDSYRDVLKEGQPKTALRMFEGLKDRIWDSASDRIKFRLITNISSCKLRLGDEEAAIDGFLTAVTYQPTDKVGLANLTLAHLLSGEINKAKSTAKAALEQDETNADAASYLIQAHIEDVAVSDPLELIPEAIGDSEAVNIGLIHFYRARNNRKWIDEAREAVARYPNDEQIRRYAAEAKLEVIFGTDGLRIGQKPLEPVNAEKLGQAAATLQELWDKQYGSESPSRDASLAINLIQAYKIMEEEKSALTVTAQALECMPHNPYLVRLRAGFYLEEERIQEALELLRGQPENTECLLTVGEILASDEPAAALEHLKGFEHNETASPRYHLMAICLRISAWLLHPELSQDARIKAAEEEYRLLQEMFPHSLQTRIVHSKILQARGVDTSVVKQVLVEAKTALADDTPFFERFLLAKKLESIEGFEDVADVMSGQVDTSYDSPALRMLLLALLNSDQRAKADKLLAEISDKVSGQAFYLRAALTLHLRRGDFQAAEDAANHLLELNPIDLHTHLVKTDIWIRRRDDGAMRDFLGGEVEQLQGEPEEVMRLAHLLARYGFVERAYRLGYSTNLRNHKNPNVQLAYMGLLFDPGVPRDIDLSKTVVEADTAFFIKSGTGTTMTFIVEEDEALYIPDVTIAPTHGFAVAADGRRAGEKFMVKGEEWDITATMHKFLYLLHKKLEMFEHLYPEIDAIQQFRVSDEEGNTNLEPFFQKVRERHEHSERVLDAYLESSVPLEIYADFLGGDVIDAWYGLAQTGRKFKVCHGNLPERTAAIEAIEKNGKVGCVVDALTLHIIRVYGLEKAVSSVCGPITATESTIDTFRLRLERVKSHGDKPYMTLSWHNGQIYRDEITAEQVAAGCTALNAELDWIEQNIEIVPAETDQPIPGEAARIRDALSYSFLDPLLAAQGIDRLLLCEDQSYRQFGMRDFGLRVSWLQPVLMRARDSGAITPQEYFEAIFKLIVARHSFISIDTAQLVYTTGQEYHEFSILAGELYGADAGFKSHTQVLVTFLEAIWGKGNPDLRGKRATSRLLERLCFGEWTEKLSDPNSYQILDKLEEIYPNPAFLRYLTNWQVGHVVMRVGYRKENPSASSGPLATAVAVSMGEG